MQIVISHIELTIFCIFFSPKIALCSGIFCTFASDSKFPKRKTFLESRVEKLSETENFLIQQSQ